MQFTRNRGPRSRARERVKPSRAPFVAARGAQFLPGRRFSTPATNVIDPEFGHLIPSVDKEFIDPIAELGPHVAPLGISFYDKAQFPPQYKNSIFVALHGSWNRTKKSGYKVVLIKLDNEGNYLGQEDFITGWLKEEAAWGRPVSPFVMSDGSLLISDDKYDVIYRVSYTL